MTIGPDARDDNAGHYWQFRNSKELQKYPVHELKSFYSLVFRFRGNNKRGCSGSFVAQSNYQKSTAGFTLLELLLYLSLVAVILLVITSLWGSVLAARVKNQTITEVGQQAVQALQLITQITRNAESITTPVANATSSSLILNVIDAAKDPTIINVSNGALQITEGSSTAIALTNTRVTLSNLLFGNLSRASTPGSVRIQFTMSHVNPASRNEYEYSKTFYGTATLRQP
ncbi:prepilin-type N-terminal cleavage/methylation domain-containing protein [Candidatus Uhrbacteria bacterium]|nr:prepilin-type N-terminal cleavage/methylation domain-containing protein [Candidatus Uhrbacteria bacterium]